MKKDYPSVNLVKNEIFFDDGKYCSLPKDYLKPSNKKILNEFYTKLLSGDVSKENPTTGIDPLGFNYVLLDFICYIGLILDKNKGNLKKKHPENKFYTNYIFQRIKFEYRLINHQDYVPIGIITQNLHEIRGLNSKISANIDEMLNVKDESQWENHFDNANENIKKIYVGSRLIKFILDNTKFYIPNFWETLKMNKDRNFIAHRSISKIVKIYRNDFKKDKTSISFEGSSFRLIAGDKEYFEILIKILIENALKYSSFSETIGPKVIIKETNGELFVEVHSYGNVIPESERKHIFTKGWRSSVNPPSTEGTGMGLYNALQLARHFDGNLTYDCKKAAEKETINLGWNIFILRFTKTFQHDTV